MVRPVLTVRCVMVVTSWVPGYRSRGKQLFAGAQTGGGMSWSDGVVSEVRMSFVGQDGREYCLAFSGEEAFRVGAELQRMSRGGVADAS